MNDIWKIEAILIAILLITCGAVGYGMATGMFKGEKGEKGTTGAIGPQGLKGDKGNDGHTPILGVDYMIHNGTDGKDGHDGRDASINKPAMIRLVYLTGDYMGVLPVCWNHCKYTYGITVFVDDPENEITMKTFYYGDTVDGPWNQIAIFFGNDGNYSATKEFKYCTSQGVKTVYFLIEAWDGSDISTNTFSYTITP